MLQPSSPSRGSSSSAGVLSCARAWTLLPLAVLLFLMTPTKAFAIHIVSSTTISALGTFEDLGRDMAFDDQGNLLLLGFTRNNASDIWLGKYTTGYALISSATILEPATDFDSGRAIIVDRDGKVLVLGSLSNGPDPWVQRTLISNYSQGLAFISSNTINNCTASDFIQSANGDIYVVGITSMTIGWDNGDMWLAHLDSALNLISSTTINGSANGADGLIGIAQDSNGDLWATGKVRETVGGSNLWIGKFTPNLLLISSASLDGGGDGLEAAFDIAISSIGDAWAIGEAGESMMTSTVSIWIVRYDNSFHLLGNTILSAGGQDSTAGNFTNVSPAGSMWMSGMWIDHPWISVYDANFVMVSSQVIQVDGSAGNIRFDPNGSAWMIGSAMAAGESYPDIWIARLAIVPEQIISLTTADLTVASLRWSWDTPVAMPADYYRLYQSSSGILVGTSTATTFDFIGLATNTAYGLRVAGVNPSGQGELSSSVTAFTLAAPPEAAAFTGVTETAIQANWTANGNPPGTAYTVLLSTGASPATNGYSGNLSSTTFNLAAVFTGLSPGQAYCAEVRAANGDGVPTAYTSLGSTSTTGLTVPAGFVGTTLGISSIAWSWGNVAAESGFRVVSSTDGDMSGDLAANTLTWTEVGLATNTAYTRRAVAFAATDTSTSAAVTRWTLALPPTGTALDAVYNSSIAVSWQANTNPAGTLYQVLVWKTGSSTATWEVTATSAALTGLNQNSTYYLAVRAVNGDSVVAPSDVTLSTLTLDIPVQQSVDPGLGGTIVFIPPSGAVSVNIPPQAFQQAVNVTIQTPDTVPVGGTQSTPLTATGVSIELTLDQPVQPVRPVSITVSYRDSDIVGLDETRLILARYDTLRNVWVPLLSTVDSGGNRVVGRTDHFSLFQIMQASPAGDVQSPRIFPNPLRPSQGHTGMTFMNLPAYCRVRIYTVVGELVKELQTDAAGMAAWDGTNESGRKAASGVYYVLAQGNGQSNTFKVAIQR